MSLILLDTSQVTSLSNRSKPDPQSSSVPSIPWFIELGWEGVDKGRLKGVTDLDGPVVSRCLGNQRSRPVKNPSFVPSCSKLPPSSQMVKVYTCRPYLLTYSRDPILFIFPIEDFLLVFLLDTKYDPSRFVLIGLVWIRFSTGGPWVILPLLVRPCTNSTERDPVLHFDTTEGVVGVIPTRDTDSLKGRTGKRHGFYEWQEKLRTNGSGPHWVTTRSGPVLLWFFSSSSVILFLSFSSLWFMESLESVPSGCSCVFICKFLYMYFIILSLCIPWPFVSLLYFSEVPKTTICI